MWVDARDLEKLVPMGKISVNCSGEKAAEALREEHQWGTEVWRAPIGSDGQFGTG